MIIKVASLDSVEEPNKRYNLGTRIINVLVGYC